MAKKTTKPKLAPLDPIAELIKDIVGNVAVPSPSGSALAIAANLIPTRTETTVTDLLDSAELKNFRTSFIEGMVEANVVNKALDIVRSLLVARGFLPA